MNNPFARYASETTDRALAQRFLAEGRICKALVRECLKRGYTVSVCDGEDWPVKRSTSSTQIVNALFSTDADELVIRDKAGTRVGWFQLVYGNDGYDVISDYTANEVCQSIIEAVDPIVAKVERAMCG